MCKFHFPALKLFIFTASIFFNLDALGTDLDKCLEKKTSESYFGFQNLIFNLS